MASLSSMLASVSKPSGLWPIIINGINNGLLSFGWTIVLFTIIVKVAMSPLDFLMRWNSKKTTLVQKKLQPQVDKINKKYANDKQRASMQTQALYKREGVNMLASCLISIVYLGLTMAVFFTLFADLRKYSAYQAVTQYITMEEKYDEVIDTTADKTAAQAEYDLVYANEIDGGATEEQAVAAAQAAYDTKYYATADKQAAGEAAAKVWDKNKDGWLWIQNIWIQDTQKNPMPTYDALKSIVKSGKYTSVSKAFKNIDKTKYNEVTSVARQQNKRWNGYYILAVLAIGLTFLSQFVSEIGNKVGKKKKENKQLNKYYKPLDEKGKSSLSNSTGGAMKIMKYVLPLIMAVFVIMSSASFGIYIVVSSAISILINLLINYLVKLATKKQEAEVLDVLEKQDKKNAK